MALATKEEKLATREEKEQNTIFTSLELDNDESFDAIPSDYDMLPLSDLSDEDEYKGRPVMTPVTSFTIDQDGDETTKYQCQLFLVDDDAEEYLRININLKKEGDIQENIRRGSVLYDFIGSIRELEAPGIMAQYNTIRKVDLSQFRDFINNQTKASVKVITREFNGGLSFYNSFKFTEVLKE